VFPWLRKSSTIKIIIRVNKNNIFQKRKKKEISLRIRKILELRGHIISIIIKIHIREVLLKRL